MLDSRNCFAVTEDYHLKESLLWLLGISLSDKVKNQLESLISSFYLVITHSFESDGGHRNMPFSTVFVNGFG